MPAEYEPTAEQRALVERASAIGITQAEIANQLKIDEKTLRKHFREELSSGKFKIDMTAGKTLVELMKSRDDTSLGRNPKLIPVSPELDAWLTGKEYIKAEPVPPLGSTVVILPPRDRKPKPTVIALVH